METGYSVTWVLQEIPCTVVDGADSIFARKHAKETNGNVPQHGTCNEQTRICQLRDGYWSSKMAANIA